MKLSKQLVRGGQYSLVAAFALASIVACGGGYHAKAGARSGVKGAEKPVPTTDAAFKPTLTNVKKAPGSNAGEVQVLVEFTDGNDKVSATALTSTAAKEAQATASTKDADYQVLVYCEDTTSSAHDVAPAPQTEAAVPAVEKKDAEVTAEQPAPVPSQDGTEPAKKTDSAPTPGQDTCQNAAVVINKAKKSVGTTAVLQSAVALTSDNTGVFSIVIGEDNTSYKTAQEALMGLAAKVQKK